MVLFIGDIDCQQSHAASSGDGDAPAPDEWWWSELVKLDALRQAFPGAFVYRTKGGYRILYLLATPRVLTSAEAVEGWRAEYLAWIAALRLRFQIYADPSCHDWQRLYRVPHATRVPGGRPEARETLGSPYQIGSWFCESTDEERALARTLAKKPSTRKPRVRRKTGETSIGDRNGVLFRVFKAREWLGDAIETGKWRARCPWEDQHTKGDPYNTSTVLFAPGSGEIWGWLHCSHGHCAHRDIRDVLKIFSEDELTRAKREAGVVTPAAQQKPLHRLYRPHFGVRVKGVRRAS